ncbi:hypothetical protein DsansV1_C06g0062311 [Dioscorea sansibarensis]
MLLFHILSLVFFHLGSFYMGTRLGSSDPKGCFCKSLHILHYLHLGYLHYFCGVNLM